MSWSDLGLSTAFLLAALAVLWLGEFGPSRGRVVPLLGRRPPAPMWRRVLPPVAIALCLFASIRLMTSWTTVLAVLLVFLVVAEAMRRLHNRAARSPA